MPCNSDYLNPTDAERDSKRTCQHIVYLSKHLNKTIPFWVAKTAKENYGNPEILNQAVRLLCSLCSGMSKKDQANIIYNGMDSKARKLADWWDEHREADRIRERAAKAIAHKDTIKKGALAKLTPEERKVLGVIS